jgi:hypothetical protein
MPKHVILKLTEKEAAGLLAAAGQTVEHPDAMEYYDFDPQLKKAIYRAFNKLSKKIYS